jgi:hypothetical protein
MSTNENLHRILGQKIADALFLDHTGNECDRLEMKYKTMTGEFAGAGWCKSAVKRMIANILESDEGL